MCTLHTDLLCQTTKVFNIYSTFISEHNVEYVHLPLFVANLQYLLRNGITEISRDNFSYSTKIKVGDFYEAREGPEASVQ